MSELLPEQGRKPFALFLQEQRNGGLHGELSDLLSELVRAVSETQKKGSLTLQVIVEANADGATVTVSDKVKLALPEADRGASIHFFDSEGNLSRRNPAQMELSLRDSSQRKAGEVA